MDGVEIKLLMSFLTSSGKKVSLFVTDPRDDIKESEIKAVMDLIIEKNIFKMEIHSSKKNFYYTGLDSTKYINNLIFIIWLLIKSH